MLRVAAGLGLASACALLGLVVGLAAVALYQSWAFLLLAAVSCVAVVVALPRAWWSRLPFVAGFAVLVLRGTLPRAEGDYLVAATSHGYALLALTLLLVVAAFVTLPRPARRPARRAGRDPGGSDS
ncbi:MAG: hypothetical protein LH468_01250 [Nocardioides sp.]|nr:hypothetical protein [Nocardioides sp.]